MDVILLGVSHNSFYKKNVFSRMQTTAESMGYIKFEGMWIFYFDLDVKFTLMYELDLINNF